MAKIPERVKVGPIYYTVEESREKVRDFRHNTGDGIYGSTDHVTTEIILDPDMSPHRKPVTLWHEVKHCVFEVTGLTAEDELDEEKVIKCTSATELAVLKENPKLVKYLLEGE